MKKLLLAAILCISLPATAQTLRNAIKLNTISLYLKTGSLFYERQVASNRSLNLGFLVANYSSASKLSTRKTEGRGFGLTGEYRFYPAEKALRGWFAGPYMRFQHYNFTHRDSPFGPNTQHLVVDKTRLTTSVVVEYLAGRASLGRASA